MRPFAFRLGKPVEPEYTYRLTKYHKVQDAFVQKKETASPIVIEIEPTTACQLACIFCPRGSLQRPEGRLSINDLGQVLDNLNEYSKESILVFSGFGEPMLHDHLEDLVSLAKQRGWFCGITTNGALITPSAVEKLLSSGLDVLQISLHAATESTYQQVVKKGPYKKIVSNLQKIIPLCKDQIVLSLNFTKIPYNRKEIQAFVSYWKQQGIPCINISSCHNRGGHLRDSRLFQGTASPATEPGCWCFRNTLYITWEGRLLACCNDIAGEGERGDLRSKTLRQIKADEEFRRFRPFFSICRCCDFPFR